MKYPRRWRLFYAVLLTLTRWDVLRFGLLFLAGALGYLAIALIPPWPEDAPEPTPAGWQSFDRRELPTEFIVGGVDVGERGLTWPEPTIGEPEPPLSLDRPEGTISSRVDD
jgi:hypothetical protein